MIDSADAGAERALPAPDRALARWLVAAWLAPALGVTLAALRALLLDPDGVAASVALAGIAALSWIALCLAPPVRRILLEIGAILALRVDFAVWLVAGLLLLALVAARGGFAAGLTAAVLLLCAASAREARRRDRARFRAVLALVALELLLLVALDALVGAFVLPARSHNHLFTEHDPLLGWRLRRGLSATRRTDAFVATETINRHGFRTPEISFEKPAGTLRLVFLGDSHTEGYTVNDAETYTRLIEARLSAERKVEVVSLGVGGYSTDQELLAYLEHGRRYSPDLVVLQLCNNDIPFNVLGHSWRSQKPVFERHGATLVLTGTPVPNLRDTRLFGSTWLRRSSLGVFLEMALGQLAIEREVERTADSDEAWIVTDLLLRDLGVAVARDGARLAAFLANPDSKLEARLQRLLAERGIPYLATRAAYVDELDSYFVKGHWNQKGQRAIAEVLVPPLRALLASAQTADARL